MKIESLYQLFLEKNGISIDSRLAVKETLFFAIKGDNFDGNKFAKNALDNGCSYAIVDNKNFLTDNRFSQC